VEALLIIVTLTFIVGAIYVGWWVNTYARSKYEYRAYSLGRVTPGLAVWALVVVAGVFALHDAAISINVQIPLIAAGCVVLLMYVSNALRTNVLLSLLITVYQIVASILLTVVALALWDRFRKFI